MRVVTIAIGTRGDVQPMLALSSGLRRAGHDVVLATEAAYERAAMQANLRYHGLTGNSERFYAGAAGIAFRESIDKSPAEFRRFWTSYISPIVRPHLHEIVPPCADADMVVCQPWLGIGPALADLGIPACVASVFPVPVLPTRTFPFIFSERATPGLSPEANWRSWRRSVTMLRPAHELVQHWRADTLKLARQTFRESLEALNRLPHVLGYSPLIVPKAPEWPARVEVTGYWFAESAADYEPPADLLRFLAAGDPPVVIGFGSHVGRDPARLTRTILDALRIANYRGILITGWGGLDPGTLPEEVFASRGVPYDWLLPRVQALVHHGGAGTTAIALRMGTPQVITPFGYDQTFWGGRVALLGVGDFTAPARRVTAEELAAVIRRATGDEAIRQRAAEVGEAIRREHGVRNAVAAIERFGRTH
jgi:sterol 3beta-glucosyltransferase